MCVYIYTSIFAKIAYFCCLGAFHSINFYIDFPLSQRRMLDTFVLQYKAETKAISPLH